ncbi:MAG TPA: hypothetical protein VGM06_12785 [Polyangiaceae bacterium]|jgi:hypothetical protein
MFRKLIGLGSTLAAAAVLTSATAHAATPGCTASGVLPSAFPSRMLLGIASDGPDDTWAQQSGTKWDVQWMYLTGQAGNNWYNNFNSGPANGSWISGVMSTLDGYGFIPGFHLYNMGSGHSGGDSGILTEIQTVSWTTEYFTEFKVLMQKAKAFGKPVVIVLEGDSFGFLENLTNNNPNTMAAVASTGLPELASLPNTVAGFGMAYLAMRKAAGAYNVAMGPDTPYYAAQGDIMNFAPTDTAALAPHVAFQWTFFGSFVGANATGDRFDFTASCPDASDCAAYTDGRPCWDPSDTASVNTPSVNRYIQWLSLFNQTSGVNWLLHQVPLGNSQHKNVPFDGSARSGYQDNKAEYLFQVESPASTAIRDQHVTNFANAGVIGMLFGSSDDGDTPATDLWKDNLPFLKTHVALLNNAPATGFAISRSCDGGAPTGSSSGGSTTSSSSSGTGTTSSSGGSTGTASSSSGSGGQGNGSSGGGSNSGGAAGSSGSTGAGTSSGSSGDGGDGFGEAKTSGGCALGGRSAPGGSAGALLFLSAALWLRRRRSV